jgi:hypothetical protein
VSEGQSYLDLARRRNFWGILGEGAQRAADEVRVLVEAEALDSFQNMLFSLLVFWKRFGAWPAETVVVTHGFKRARVVELHGTALGFGAGRGQLGFVGVDPEYMASEDEGDRERAESVRRGERERGYGAWKEDPYGVAPFLTAKRKGRNPWGVPAEEWIEGMDAEVKSLLEWRQTSLFDGNLPWADAHNNENLKEI